MKKIYFLVISLLLILCSFRGVSADTNRIIVDGPISDYFLEGDYAQLEEDLQHVKDTYNIDPVRLEEAIIKRA